MKLGAEAIGRLSALLDEAIDLDPAARVAWLARLSAVDLALRPTLERLLAVSASPETADLLERGPSLTGFADAPAADAEFAPGDHVGPYRLERTIGQGGMGEVWLALRDDGQLKRPVALKLPILGARRSLLVQRFARERDILGSLTHPHIARLYDAGVADGQPYLALEYVEGRPITTYCEDLKLGLRERVTLLQQVLGAVQYAHANLVVHRDLKPSNVLVTAEGKAMLLDFGIAKLLLDDATEAAETELTHIGGRAMTLHYAAPEQVSGEPISIATDVWALGVLAYELLAGSRPFTGKARDLEQAVLTADPAKPAQLPSDLATIVLKALKKAPAERYATADAFAEDLRRWRAGEPVLAQPDRFGYRVRKFVGRHRVGVATSGLVATALLVTSLAAVRQAAEARRQAVAASEQAALAQQESRRAQAVQGFLIDLFRANQDQQADPQAARRTTARDLLDRGAARIDQALAESPQARIDVMDTLADMYFQLKLNEQASALQERRLALARSVLPANDPKRADVLLSYAQTLNEGGQRDRIPGLIKEAVAIIDAAGQAGEPLRATALIVAAIYARYEPLAEAIRSADEAAAYLARFAPQRGSLVTAYQLAARARLNAGDAEGAIQQAGLAIATAERRGAGATAWLAGPTSLLAEALQAQLRCEDAEAKFRLALAMGSHLGGADAPDVAFNGIWIGNLLLSIGRTAEGLAAHAPARAALAGTDPRMTARWRENVAWFLEAMVAERGRPERTLAPIGPYIERLREDLPRSSVLAQNLRRLAELQADVGDAKAARVTMAEADSLWRRVSSGASTGPIDTAFAITRAHVALAAGAPEEALAQLAASGPALPRDEIAREVERAAALLASKRPTEALAAADDALRRLDAVAAPCRPVTLQAWALQRRGEALRDSGDRAGAIGELERAAELRRRHDADGSRWLAGIERELAALRTGRSERPRGG